MFTEDIENEYGGDFGEKESLLIYSDNIENEYGGDFSYLEPFLIQKVDIENEYGGDFGDKSTVINQMENTISFDRNDYDFDEYGGVFEKKTVQENDQNTRDGHEQISANININEYGGEFGEKQDIGDINDGATDIVETDGIESVDLSCSFINAAGDVSFLQCQLSRLGRKKQRFRIAVRRDDLEPSRLFSEQVTVII